MVAIAAMAGGLRTSHVAGAARRRREDPLRRRPPRSRSGAAWFQEFISGSDRASSREQCRPHVFAQFEWIEEEWAAAGDAQAVALWFQADRIRDGAVHDGFDPTRHLLDLLNGAAPEVRCSARARAARHLRRQMLGQVHGRTIHTHRTDEAEPEPGKLPQAGLNHRMDPMREPVVRSVGLVVVLGYAALIAWLFASQPRTMAEAVGGLSANLGTYGVDEQAFADGLAFFRNDQFVEARSAFARADPATRDAVTQFYLAYSFYRQGWHRTHHRGRAVPAGPRARRARDRACHRAADWSSTTPISECARPTSSGPSWKRG